MAKQNFYYYLILIFSVLILSFSTLVAKTDQTNPTNSTDINLSDKELLAQAIGYFEQQNFKQAIEIFSQESIAEKPESKFYIAQMYDLGILGEVNHQLSAQLYQQAADDNYPNAMRALALVMIEGKGVLQNFEKAEQYLAKAAKKNDKQSLYIYGVLLSQGKIFELNRQKAFELWLKGAKLDDVNCQINLAKAYSDGLGTNKNLNQANDWYLKAAKQKNNEALFALANHYENAKGYPKDLEKAHMFYNLASLAGNPNAQQKMIALSDELSLAEIKNAQQMAEDWLNQNWQASKDEAKK